MSYKDAIKNRIEVISQDVVDFDDEVIRGIEEVYQKALEESRITGESVESVTFEILEGVEEVLFAHHESTLAKVSDKMTDIIHQSAKICIDTREKKLEHAIVDLRESVAREQSHLQESMRAFHAFSKEKSLRRLRGHLLEKEKHIQALLQELSQRLISQRKEEQMHYHDT